MNSKFHSNDPCQFRSALRLPSNLAFRRHHRMRQLHRLLPHLRQFLDALQMADVGRDLELIYWPALGLTRRPCFFEVPAFLGVVEMDQPMEPAMMMERLMAVACPELPLEVMPAACNLERLRKHLDLSRAEQLRLLSAYLNYGGAAWPDLELSLDTLQSLLAMWWRVSASEVSNAVHGRLNDLGLMEQPVPVDSVSLRECGCTLAVLLAMPTSVVMALSEKYATDGELMDALQLPH